MKLNIGKNIKRLRGEKGVTQEQLAEVMNVTCAAVSKWERGETFPDITLLQPLAYYFGITIDELMGYDSERVKAQIDDTLGEYWKQYRKATKEGYEAARDIIASAYRAYPGDYRVMACYMWFIAGGSADNDPKVLLAHRDEFLSICAKILDGCNDDRLRLDAWNMRAKILQAEGRTDEALAIYRREFTDWYQTCGQKSEQLFAKGTDEYAFWVRKNLYELFGFAADKLGRTVFFDKGLTNAEKVEKTLLYGELLIEAYEKTGEDAFLVVANGFLGRVENDLCYRGGTDGEVAEVMDKHLQTLALLDACVPENSVIKDAVFSGNPFWAGVNGTLAGYLAASLKGMKEGRRAELLENPKYTDVLAKYADANCKRRPQ